MWNFSQTMVLAWGLLMGSGAVSQTPSNVNQRITPVASTVWFDEKVYRLTVEETKRKISSIISTDLFGYSIGITEAKRDLGFTGANLIFKRNVSLGVTSFSPWEKQNMAMEIRMGNVESGSVGIFVQGKIVF